MKRNLRQDTKNCTNHKRKNNKFYFIKIKTFFSSKDITKKMKMQVTDGNCVPDIEIEMHMTKVLYLNSHKSIIK